MLIIVRKEDETIDRVLKRYKNKHRKVGITSEMRKRKEFTKPSVKKRNVMLKAAYIKKKYGSVDS